MIHVPTLFEFEQLLKAKQIQKWLRHSNLKPFIEIFSFHNDGKTQHVPIDLKSSAGGRSEKSWGQTVIEELNLPPPPNDWNNVNVSTKYREGEGKCNPAPPVQPGLRT